MVTFMQSTLHKNSMPRLEELIDQNQMRRAVGGAAPFEPNAFMESLS